MYDWINLTVVPIVGAVVSAYLQQKTMIEIRLLRESLKTMKEDNVRVLKSTETKLENLTFRVKTLESK